LPSGDYFFLRLATSLFLIVLRTLEFFYQLRDILEQGRTWFPCRFLVVKLANFIKDLPLYFSWHRTKFPTDDFIDNVLLDTVKHQRASFGQQTVIRIWLGRFKMFD
jgi:hypothetical protein